MTKHELKKRFFYFHRTGAFTHRKTGKSAFRPSIKNGREICIDGKYYKAQKLAWLYVYGEYPDCDIVATNGDILETRIEKLIKKTKGFIPEKRLSLEELKTRLSYHKETGLFLWKKSNINVKKGDVAGTKRKENRQIKINGKYYMNSRLSWLFTHGSWPKYRLSHLNKNSLDDRATNLYPIKKGIKPKPLLKTKIKGLFKNQYTQRYELSGHREFKTKESAIKALLIDKAMGINRDESKEPHKRIREVQQHRVAL